MPTKTTKKTTRKRRAKDSRDNLPAQGAASQVNVADVGAAAVPKEVKKRSRRRTTKKQPKKKKAGAVESSAEPEAPSAAFDVADAETVSQGGRVSAAPPAEHVEALHEPGDRPAKRRRGTRGGRRKRTARERAATTAAVEEVAPAEVEPVPAPSRGKIKIGEFRGDRKSLSGKDKRVMVIETTAGEECRIAVLHEGHLEQLFIERASSASHVGNIYKGRITNVEPSIQAVFVDFGLPKNGFLHISDVQPQYFPEHTGEAEEVGRKIPRHNRPPIQKCFRRGQEVIVQITKEGVGTKGPTLTSYLSIPGRFLVMMPGMNRHGVSRKIEDDEVRRKMRDMMKELNLPGGMGFIMRTAGVDQSKRELQRDLQYLMRLWRTVVDRIKGMGSPAELYRESDLVTRTIRDVYTSDFTELILDDEDRANAAVDFLQLVMPRTKSSVKVYARRDPLFHRLGIEEEIERINMRHVPLPSGGSLVIDSTEAMVAIDVNSGRFRSPEDAEETALRINVEAAEEIARQLRLRDLGGLIVCDFIDMRADRNKRKVERALRDALKKHKERARLLRMSAFGLIEITRQRQGPSLKRNIYFDCTHCRGSGLIKMPESVTLDVMRLVQLAAHHDHVHKVTITVSSEVAYRILNTKRATISSIEEDTGKSIVIHGDESFTSDQIECACEDGRGRSVSIGPALGEGKRGR